MVDLEGKIYRVLSSKKFQQALGISRHIHTRLIVLKGSYSHSDEENHTITLPPFLSAQNLFEFIDDSAFQYFTPIYYSTGTNMLAKGYRAELLPEACVVYMKAKWAGVLLHKRVLKHLN